ncbi:uncharacterized protein LOC135687367 [Rhopilema esculentum]|uniref:uncharacterized protein LOC135687367 n=1 Tax=Rhopilema esculentum TaxID=499914 RepID=UPI0031E0C694
MLKRSLYRVENTPFGDGCVFDERHSHNHHSELEKICALAKQDLLQKSRERESTGESSLDVSSSRKSGIGNRSPWKNSLPFLRVSRKVQRCQDQLNCSGRVEIVNESAYGDVFDQTESLSENSSTPSSQMIREQAIDFGCNSNIGNNSQRTNGAQPSICITPDHQDLPHPSKLRPKKPKVKNSLGAMKNSAKGTKFDINCHLQQLKRKCRDNPSYGFRAMLSSTVRKVPTGTQGAQSDGMLCIASDVQTPNRMFYRGRGQYLSLYADSVCEMSESRLGTTGNKPFFPNLDFPDYNKKDTENLFENTSGAKYVREEFPREE